MDEATLLRLIAALLARTSGTVFIERGDLPKEEAVVTDDNGGWFIRSKDR